MAAGLFFGLRLSPASPAVSSDGISEIIEVGIEVRPQPAINKIDQF
jgi:hypothetical protein